MACLMDGLKTREGPEWLIMSSNCSFDKSGASLEVLWKGLNFSPILKIAIHSPLSSRHCEILADHIPQCMYLDSLILHVGIVPPKVMNKLLGSFELNGSLRYVHIMAKWMTQAQHDTINGYTQRNRDCFRMIRERSNDEDERVHAIPALFDASNLSNASAGYGEDIFLALKGLGERVGSTRVPPAHAVSVQVSPAWRALAEQEGKLRGLIALGEKNDLPLFDASRRRNALDENDLLARTIAKLEFVTIADVFHTFDGVIHMETWQIEQMNGDLSEKLATLRSRCAALDNFGTLAAMPDDDNNAGSKRPTDEDSTANEHPTKKKVA
jgi:hypothetical protein